MTVYFYQLSTQNSWHRSLQGFGLLKHMSAYSCWAQILCCNLINYIVFTALQGMVFVKTGKHIIHKEQVGSAAHSLVFGNTQYLWSTTQKALISLQGQGKASWRSLALHFWSSSILPLANTVAKQWSQCSTIISNIHKNPTKPLIPSQTKEGRSLIILGFIAKVAELFLKILKRQFRHRLRTREKFC